MKKPPSFTFPLSPFPFPLSPFTFPLFFVDRKPLDSVAFATMVLCCFVWGFTNVATKLAAADITPVMQSGLRSILATVLLMIWARSRHIPLFDKDGTLQAGLIAGALFAGEFLFIYAGLAHTGASRMVVFVYTAPCLTALGLHWFVPGERLHAAQWIGILLAFGGIVTAFGDGFAASPASLLGDAFGVIGGVLWAATTVWIRATGLTRISAAKVLFYQLAVSSLTLPVASWLMGEAGVMMGAVVLSEPLRPAFLGALAMVGTGIFLVNRPARPG